MYRVNSGILAIFLALAIVFSSSIAAYAEICGGGYPREMRTIVLSREVAARQILERMAELAENSARASHLGQTIANEQVFAYGITELNQFGEKTFTHDVRTTTFFDTIIDSDYLGIGALTVTGDTLSEAQSNAREALAAIGSAIKTVGLCLHDSYDRLQVVGQPNNVRCAGGFSEGDWRVVVDNYIVLRDTLIALKGIAERSATQILSRNDRKISQSDMLFLIQQIMTIGVTDRATTQRTMKFLKQYFNPVSLGVAIMTVEGSNSSDAQINSQKAMASVDRALTESRRCVLFLR